MNLWFAMRQSLKLGNKLKLRLKLKLGLKFKQGTKAKYVFDKLKTSEAPFPMTSPNNWSMIVNTMSLIIQILNKIRPALQKDI